MGGFDDDEPSAKRLKLSEDLGHLTNNCSTAAVSNCSGLMAKHLSSRGKEEMVGPKGLIKRVEFVRIITKALYSLGYERSGALLEEESGIRLHSAIVDLFRKQLLDGNWDESVTTLQKIADLDSTVLKSASFLILEQKFIELLENDNLLAALKTLRSEITPLGVNVKRVHELCGYIISQSQCRFPESNGHSDDGSTRLRLLEGLQKLLPPTIMIPERRLEHLVEQALHVQREACIFHNSLDNSLSLYSDHQCGKGQIPSRTLQVLHAHNEDVWFIRFSNNGKYLASASNDKSAIIWEVQDDGEVTLKHNLVGHQKPVLMVAWSPDDSMLLTCGMEETVRCWNVISGDCVHVYEKSGIGLVSCGWFPDGKSIITGVADKTICAWDLDGKELESWKGQKIIRISDVAVTTTCKMIITICKENTILLLDQETKAEKLIEEESTITSFSLSRDEKFILINLVNQEIHVWSIDDVKLQAKYRGHKRSRFVIRSCFGGFDEAFIASGSEDSQVYIWHRSTRELVEALPGHSGSVNCVSWNPTNPHMLASGSDDHTIRIWGIDGKNSKKKFSNGVAHCNGNSK